MTNAADLGSTALVGNFIYGGVAYSNNTLDLQNNPEASETSIFEEFVGYAINANALDMQSIISSEDIDQSYTGYAAAYNGIEPALEIAKKEYSTLIDNNPVLPHPKDQRIYYKLVGYNTDTQIFESWIIVENIVARTETFDPSGSFPNIDNDVYFSPPSGNNLSNIKIVGRWIQ